MFCFILGSMNNTSYLNDAQRATVESTWTPETNMSIPQYVERFAGELIRYANTDLAWARKDSRGMHLVAQTNVGTVVIIYRRKDGVNPQPVHSELQRRIRTHDEAGSGEVPRERLPY